MPSQDNRRSIPFFIVIILIEVIVILLLATENWMQQVIRTEQRSLHEIMGEKQSVWIERTARRWYDQTVIDTGFLDATYKFMLPTPEQTEASGDANHLGDTIFPVARSRLSALFSVIYQMYVRLALMVAWTPFFLVAGFTAIVDGMMTWRIRQFTFANTSTVVHRSAITITGWCVVAMILSLFVPFPLSPAIFPLIGTVVVFAAVLIAANTQKRI